MSETVPQNGLQFHSDPTVQDIFKIRMFEEPLVPIGATPTSSENAALAATIVDYSKRTGPEDFSSLSQFLEAYPESSWSVGLLTNLGIDYYKTGRYSKALRAWRQAWDLAKATTDPSGVGQAEPHTSRE